MVRKNGGRRNQPPAQLPLLPPLACEDAPVGLPAPADGNLGGNGDLRATAGIPCGLGCGCSDCARGHCWACISDCHRLAAHRDGDNDAPSGGYGIVSDAAIAALTPAWLTAGGNAVPDPPAPPASALPRWPLVEGRRCGKCHAPAASRWGYTIRGLRLRVCLCCGNSGDTLVYTPAHSDPPAEQGGRAGNQSDYRAKVYGALPAV